MAYYNKNPDALPAHAEPEQAAQLLAGYQDNRPPSHPPPGQGPGGFGKPMSPQPNQYGQRPPPQQQHQHHQQQGYGGGGYGQQQHQQQHHQQQQQPYGKAPPPGGFGNAPPPQGGFGNAPPPQGGFGNAPPPHGGFGNAPPPGGFGNAPPPGGFGQRPPPSRPPPTPAPQSGADPTLFPLFSAVDKDGSGQLTERELGAALVNGDWSSFDPHTVRMMIRMFDTDRSGTIGFNEFCGLWGFLAAWRSLFDRFDTDMSGNISYDEFQNALSAFGYRLSPQFVQLLFRSYDRRGQDSSPARQGQDAISFDLFVQSCISLKRMTEVFKKYDDDRDGYITLSFEEFLTEILRQR